MGAHLVDDGEHGGERGERHQDNEAREARGQPRGGQQRLGEREALPAEAGDGGRSYEIGRDRARSGELMRRSGDSSGGPRRDGGCMHLAGAEGEAEGGGDQ